MTIKEFKKLNPEYDKIEGDQLWNAMEDYMLEHGDIKENGKIPNIPPSEPDSFTFVELDISKGFKVKKHKRP